MSIFHFKEFSIEQGNAAMKVGTDALILGSLISVGDFCRGLDIGTGTGVLALMVAQRNPMIQIDAIEKDLASIQDCKVNFKSSKWDSRLKAIHNDFLDFSRASKYDLIITNPPYYQTKKESENPRSALTKHTSALPPRDLISALPKLLADEGEFWIIIPSIDNEYWLSLFNEFDLNVKRQIDLFGKEGGKQVRVVYCIVRQPSVSISSELVIRTKDGAYTSAYISLTRDFHGKELS